MVVAIDFGTTYSGYAFSLGTEFESEPTKISSNKPWNASQGLVSHKTPTCVLLKPDKSFYKFGYEAEDKYNDIAGSGNDYRLYYYFRRFKMALHSCRHLTRETTIEDETGKSLQAMTIFKHSIRYLMDHALNTINTQGKVIDEMDIHWVLTVPAIWSDGAKQFMREAAQKAGIETNNLSIALEPEAASVYCKYLPSHQLTQEKMSKSMFRKGSKYMVVDLGGGTADITVHKVESDDSLCEIHGPSGGAWGGTKVDEAFINFLAVDLFGEDVMKSFLNDCMEDAIDLYRDFELKKRKVKLDMSETPSMALKIPVALYELYKEKNKSELKEDIKNKEKYKGKVTCMADKMKIDSNIMKSFFKKPLEDLVEHMRDILGELPVRGTDTFIMVGGFAESEIVQDTIKQKFSNMQVITPFDAGLAVLKGAVIFGHAPMVITSRVCRRTYGMAVSKPYVKGKYKEDRKEVVSGREIVRNVFHKYMELGHPTKVGEAVSTVPLTASSGQSLARVRIFSSKEKNPEFVTDRGCSCLGEIIINIPEMEQDEGGTVDVKMTFGGTELAVEATEKKSGKSFRSRFDFLTGD